MTAPYDDLIPNGTDAMQLSAAQLRSNFIQIYNAYAENHVPLTTPNDLFSGMHTELEMKTQSDPSTLSDEVALYSKTGTGSQPQIFFRASSSGNVIQLSNNKVISTGPNYQSFIAGPYIWLFGKITGISNGTVITYTTYYPGLTFSEVEFIDIQVTGTIAFPQVGFSAGVSNITTTTFTINTNAVTPADFYYFIIGKPS
jgi:hypothetical protein